MPQRLKAQGEENPDRMWDYGSDRGDIANIWVRGDSEGIMFIGFDYIKDGQLTYGSSGPAIVPGFTQMFEINHLDDEQLVSVEFYYRTPFIRGIQFKTNLRISELMGVVKDCSKFSLAVDGKKIIGFHGSFRYRGTGGICSLGAYFTWISPTRLDAKGQYGGNEWDDGADHEGITKIYLRGGPEGIRYIKFDYVKNGKQIYGQAHGGTGSGFTQTFELNHLQNEYLVSVEGYYDDSKTSGVIQGIQFKSNIKTSELMGYDIGKKFRLASNGKIIIGFHGYSEKNLNSLGAYFKNSAPITKLESKGKIDDGVLWDDGTFEGVRNVYFFFRSFPDNGYGYFNRILLNYDKTGTMIPDDDPDQGEFEVDYPNEFITRVEGTLYSDKSSWAAVSSLTFKTSKGRTSPTFGTATTTKFVLERKGCALVGFHGMKDSYYIKSLGAYFRPLPLAPAPDDAEKLEARGGDGGTSWDDGVSDGIRYINIGHGELGIAFVKFMFYRDDRLVVGDHHGGKIVLGVEEFELEDAPDEYLISVEGNYAMVDDGYHKSKSEVIVMLRFKTNKRTSPTFGTEAGTSFILQKEKHKIVGFHGKSSTTLHQIGVHVLPIT